MVFLQKKNYKKKKKKKKLKSCLRIKSLKAIMVERQPREEERRCSIRAWHGGAGGVERGGCGRLLLLLLVLVHGNGEITAARDDKD